MQVLAQEQIATPMDDGKIHCVLTSGAVEPNPGNNAFPIRFFARATNGQEVELLCSPYDADRIGREFINCACEALTTWRPTNAILEQRSSEQAEQDDDEDDHQQ